MPIRTAQNGRRVTQADIARYLGIGQNTVSRALRDGASVRPNTRQRVLDAARDLGYRVSTHARAMRDGRMNAVALLQGATTLGQSLPLRLLNSVHRALSEHGMHLLLDRLPALDELSGGVPDILRQWMVDGFLVNHSNERRPDVQERLRQEPSPVVWINFDIASDCVRPDDQGGAREAVERLAALGHRRIAYAECGGTRFEDVPSHFFAEQRFTGYLKAMADAGLPPILINQGKGVAGTRRVGFLASHLAGPDRPTAVVCMSRDTALPALLAAWRLGIDVPEDLSVISIDSGPDDVTGRSVSTMVLPHDAIGGRAVEMILAKIDDPSQTFPAEAVPLIWHEGQTCAAPCVSAT